VLESTETISDPRYWGVEASPGAAEEGGRAGAAREAAAAGAPYAEWQHRFLREVLQVVTEGRLRLCEDASHLPVPGLTVAPTLALDAAVRLGDLRRLVSGHAEASGFSPERCADLVAGVGEAALNTVVHAGGGHAHVRRSDDTLQVWVEDHGTGIPLDFLHRATLERGFSTIGSLGQGFLLMLQTCDRVYLRTDETGTTVVLEQDRVRAEEDVVPSLPRASQDPAADGQALDDAGRLAALDETGLMDSALDEDFDRFTRLAARVLNTPIALITLVDDRRQFFKSAVGLPEPWSELRQTPLSHSFCQHVVLNGRALLVEDAARDETVRTNRATRDLGVTAYAGVPLVTPGGDILGSLSVIDNRPRRWSDEEVGLLRDLADSVCDRIATRVAARAAERQTRLLMLSNDAIVVRDAARGGVTFWNPAAGALYGWSAAEVMGHPMERFLDADDPTLRRVVSAELRSSGHWEGEMTFLRRDGTPVVVASRQAIQYDEQGRAIAILQIDQDVTERRRVEAALQADLARQHRIAVTLQEALLLKPASDHFDGLDVATLYAAALEEADIGGDFFDVFGLSDGRVALVVGDVSGKGLEAARRTAQIKYALRAFLREDTDPGCALTRLNRFVWQTQSDDPEASLSFTVAAVAVLTPESGEMSVAVAGAEPPCIVRKPRSGRARVEVCDTQLSGLPLGVMPDEEYVGTEMYLHPGDRIALMTDGLIEAKGYEEEEDRFGLARLSDLLAREGGLWSVGQGAMKQARDFAGGELQDDACLVIAERTGALPVRRLGLPGVSRL